METLSKKQRKNLYRDLNSEDPNVFEKLQLKYPHLNFGALYYKETGESILHIACRKGAINIVRNLLKVYKDDYINWRSKHDKAAVHEAAQFGQYEILSLLIENGADVNGIKMSDWTPLMLSCTNYTDRTYDVVNLLLSVGAHVNCSNKDGWSVLHIVARLGSIEIFKLLLVHKIDITKKTRNGQSALHIACLHGNLEIARKFVELGLNIEDRDCCGTTPIFNAVLSNNIELCKYLVSIGSDLSCRNKSGMNLLHAAVAGGNEDTIKFVVKDLLIDLNGVTEFGATALVIAATKKRKAIYDMLVEWGAKEGVDKLGRMSTEYFDLNK